MAQAYVDSLEGRWGSPVGTGREAKARGKGFAIALLFNYFFASPGHTTLVPHSIDIGVARLDSSYPCRQKVSMPSALRSK